MEILSFLWHQDGKKHTEKERERDEKLAHRKYYRDFTQDLPQIFHIILPISKTLWSNNLSSLSPSLIFATKFSYLFFVAFLLLRDMEKWK